MATGYTAPVQSGEITTFPEFAMNTARAMGAAIAMRDMDSEAEMTDENLSFGTESHERGIADATERLKEVSAWTPEEADEEARKYNQERLKNYLRRVRDSKLTRQRYGAMLVQAEAWVPPTAEHIGLKQYMIDQLTGSIDFDCMNPEFDERPKKIDGATLRMQEIESAVSDIAYHAKQKAETDSANESRIRWVRTLETSLADDSA